MTERLRLVLVGAGGHGSVVLAAARACGIDSIAVIDIDERRWGSRWNDLTIAQASDDDLHDFSHAELGALVTVGSTGPASSRPRIFANLLAQHFRLATIVHPSAIVDPSVNLGRGVFVAAGVIVNPNASIGDNVILNTGAVAEHDCLVEAHSHIAPGAILGGGVRVGMDCHVGIGAVVLPGIRVGDSSLVGAGAVVTRDVASGSRVIGVPAKPFA
ncbi:MAG TPA: acetyltransferase [Vicinamibacterales bacterium]|jgi:sugar O-acyltransferase (sialic acid O-acetyltransferase NeuD family)|nr:acetyltransferase [Vicinamibacterales bacterium]